MGKEVTVWFHPSLSNNDEKIYRDEASLYFVEGLIGFKAWDLNYKNEIAAIYSTEIAKAVIIKENKQ